MKRGLAVIVATLLFTVAATPSRSYKRSLKEHTRDLVIYQGFETALFMRATLLTKPFRRDYADARRILTGTTDDEHADFVRRNEEDAAVFHEVVFSSDSPKSNHTFGETDQGWLIRLAADGQDQSLVSVHEIDKPTTVQRALFTHLNIWSDLWVARFASTVADPSKVEFHVGSGYGNGSMVWER